MLIVHIPFHANNVHPIHSDVCIPYIVTAYISIDMTVCISFIMRECIAFIMRECIGIHYERMHWHSLWQLLLLHAGLCPTQKLECCQWLFCRCATHTTIHTTIHTIAYMYIYIYIYCRYATHTTIHIMKWRRFRSSRKWLLSCDSTCDTCRQLWFYMWHVSSAVILHVTRVVSCDSTCAAVSTHVVFHFLYAGIATWLER